jgi:hypothetical protein
MACFPPSPDPDPDSPCGIQAAVPFGRQRRKRKRNKHSDFLQYVTTTQYHSHSATMAKPIKNGSTGQQSLLPALTACTNLVSGHRPIWLLLERRPYIKLVTYQKFIGNKEEKGFVMKMWCTWRPFQVCNLTYFIFHIHLGFTFTLPISSTYWLAS